MDQNVVRAAATAFANGAAWSLGQYWRRKSNESEQRYGIRLWPRIKRLIAQRTRRTVLELLRAK